MKHRMFFLPAVGVLCALLAGCTTRVLPTGRYVGEKNANLYAVVYKDMIFLNVKTPQNAAGDFDEWVWAGKYSIDDYDNLQFDMDSKTDKEWRFYYTFTKGSQGIVLGDLSNGSSELLRYVVPARRGAVKPKPRYE